MTEIDNKPHHPIDASLLAPSLSQEIVTSGDVETLVIMATKTLEDTGVKSIVNGLPARVSRACSEVVLDGKTYVARVFQLKPARGKEPELPALVFDKTTESVAVVTENFLAIRFTRFGESYGLIADTPDSIPKVNDPEVATLVRDILTAIATESVDAKETQRREAQAAKDAHGLSRKNGFNTVKNSLQNIVGGLVLVGALGGGGYGLTNIDWKSLGDTGFENFDEHGYGLKGGNVVALGDTESPEFSQELFNRSELNQDKIATIGDGNGTDHHLSKEDTLRELVITSSQKNKNCEEADIKDSPLGAEVVAWTDFTNPNGTSRANELSLEYTLDKVRVCWDGQELNDDDDPRIVLQLRMPEDHVPE